MGARVMLRQSLTRKPMVHENPKYMTWGSVPIILLLLIVVVQTANAWNNSTEFKIVELTSHRWTPEIPLSRVAICKLRPPLGWEVIDQGPLTLKEYIGGYRAQRRPGVSYDSEGIISLSRGGIGLALTFVPMKLYETRLGGGAAPILEVNGLALILENGTGETLEVDWNRVSLVDGEGTAHRTIKSGVRLLDRFHPMAPSILPPYSRIREVIFPADHITHSGSAWHAEQFFEVAQSANPIELYLPFSKGRVNELVRLFITCTWDE